MVDDLATKEIGPEWISQGNQNMAATVKTDTDFFHTQQTKMGSKEPKISHRPPQISSNGFWVI